MQSHQAWDSMPAMWCDSKCLMTFDEIGRYADLVDNHEQQHPCRTTAHSITPKLTRSQADAVTIEEREWIYGFVYDVGNVWHGTFEWRMKNNNAHAHAGRCGQRLMRWLPLPFPFFTLCRGAMNCAVDINMRAYAKNTHTRARVRRRIEKARAYAQADDGSD